MSASEVNMSASEENMSASEVKRIVECVPNFSEGRDRGAVRQITDAIESVGDIRLLGVEPGEGTNRTVVTFVGPPEAVVEAAFRGAKRASEVIDMRRHHGTHPRMGATDVLPLIPVSGITLEECALLARQLAGRMATEAGIPCYAYEASAFRPERRNLAVCRAGEYEALYEKLTVDGRQPDFMPPCLTSRLPSAAEDIPESVRRCGCTAVGARDFLIAVNWNLNTTSVPIAKAIAADVREKGGTLRCTKAIGWYIEEYGIAQVSMNMTNLNVTPLHVAFEEVCRCALNRGVRVTGTEIIGLVPKKSLTLAGNYFLEKLARQQGRPADHSGWTEEHLVRTAVQTMRLDDLRPFNPHQKVIEYLCR